jgi:hypothetical protein
MASYADIAHRNTSGPQPHPDTALLNTSSSETTLPDVDSKVNVVPQSFKSQPTTVTSTIVPAPDQSSYENENHYTSPRKAEPRSGSTRDKAKRKVHQVEDESLQIWERAKHTVLRPGFLGGVVGIGEDSTIFYPVV